MPAVILADCSWEGYEASRESLPPGAFEVGDDRPPHDYGNREGPFYFELVASRAPRWSFAEQVADAEAFLARHADALRELGRRPGVSLSLVFKTRVRWFPGDAVEQGPCPAAEQPISTDGSLRLEGQSMKLPVSLLAKAAELDLPIAFDVWEATLLGDRLER